MIIAVDGPAASGKGTLARQLAARYDLPYLDTGLLYRAVGWQVMERGFSLQNEEAATHIAKGLDLDRLDDRVLRSGTAGEAASQVAKYASVREALLELQRNFAHQPGGAVLDGRDIGTVVCPDADVKFFITATPEVRATRRHAELGVMEPDLSYEQVLADIQKRDERDAGRKDAPMKKAEDAHALDTTSMGIDEVVNAAIAIIEAAKSAKGTKTAPKKPTKA